MIRTRYKSPGFTLTEILIALALISFLLVGISRIFAMTSSTISKGQGVSQALRAHRAIQQALSNDFLGYSATGNIDSSDNNSGMAPLVLPSSQYRGAPFLTISNFRIATYRNQADYNGAINPPVLTASNLTPAASTAIRTVRDSDGVTQRTLPLYEYGLRNFRTDTIGFFGLGDFKTQTGSVTTATYQDDGVNSDAAYIQYAQLRVFDGNPASLGFSRGHGHPGSFLTPTNTPEQNKNNRFAEQFMLGRVQNLLIEPEDYYNSASVGAATTPTEMYKYKTIVAGGDVTKPVFFARRNWDAPTDVSPLMTASNNRPTLTPLNIASLIYCYKPSANINQIVDMKDVVGGGTGQTAVFGARSDVFGAGLEELRKRCEFMVDTDTTSVPAAGSEWHSTLNSSWVDRFIVNPYSAMSSTAGNLQFDARSMGQRQHLLAECNTQFIVEFAGDFVTQNSATGAPAGGAATPDGIVDFVIVNNVRQVRWYGMPRDVDNDGTIPGPGNAARLTSPDVIPLCDFAGTRNGSGSQPTSSAFETHIPPITSGSNADYLKVFTEPAGDPDDTSYVCVWGPNEFKTGTVVGTETYYSVPQMIRFVIEIADPKGRLAEPVTQEYVFPVKVK